MRCVQWLKKREDAETERRMERLRARVREVEMRHAEAVQMSLSHEDEILTLRRRLRKKYADPQVEEEEEGKTCMCCLGEEEEVGRCEEGHPICGKCMDGQLDASSMDAPCMEEKCTSRIQMHEVVKTKEGRRCVEAAYVQKFRTKVLDKLPASTPREAVAQLMYMRPDGGYDALECPSCGLGPMEHAMCDDLQAHHMQKAGKGGVYNNGCPRCGLACNNVRQMKEWRGQ